MSAEGPSDALFRDPALRRIVLATLRYKRIPQQEQEDALQEVYLALVVWFRKETTGKDGADLRRGAKATAETIAKKYWKKVIGRGKHNVGQTDNADEHAPLPNGSTVDLIDIKDLLAEINHAAAIGKLTDRDAEILRALAEETSLLEHANETNQSYDAVRKARERAGAKLVEHLHARGKTDVGIPTLYKAALLVAAVAVVLLIALSGRLRGFIDAPVAHDPNNTRAVAADAGDAPAPRPPTIEEIARALAPPTDNRDKAARKIARASTAYRDDEWKDCIRLVDEATRLDPVAGAAPELRAGCQHEQEIDVEAKSPRKPRPHPPRPDPE